MNYTRKRSITKQTIQTAMIELLEKKRFEKITINLIVDTAHLTRGTFYRYYDDKYQLLEEIENETINNLVSASAEHNFSAGTPITRIIEPILDQYQRSFIVLHALLGPNGDPAFEDRLERRINKFFYKSKPTIEEEMLQVSVTAMWIRALRFWVFNDKKISIDDVKKVVFKLTDSYDKKIYNS